MKIKTFWAVLLVIISLALSASEKPKLVRLHYDGGGDWYNDPDALPNLVKFLNKNINTDFSVEQAIVKPSETKLFEFPFVFMTGHGNIRFSDKERQNLRKYLMRGGFIFVDDDYGMDESFRQEIAQIFPEKDLIEIPKNHEIFNCFYNFKDGIPKTHKHDDHRPQAFAIFDENGRILLLYTYESNISDGWSNAHDDPSEIKEQALRMGANIFYYLMTK